MFSLWLGKGQLELGIRGVRAERAEKLVLLWVADPLGFGSLWGPWVGTASGRSRRWETALCEMKYCLWDGSLGILYVGEWCA